MSQLAQAADQIEQMALDATRLPWGVIHHGSRTGESWLTDGQGYRQVGRASADDADLILAAVNTLPNLVALLRVIDKSCEPQSPEYLAAFKLAHKMLSQG